MNRHPQRMQNAHRRRHLTEGWKTVRALAAMGPDRRMGRESTLRDTLWKLTVGSHAR